MTRRSIPNADRAWLLTEIDVWRRAGILSAEQSGRIVDLYETSDEVAERKHSVAIFTLCSVAAVMIGLAVLLVVGYNWQAMTPTIKLTVLFGTLLGTHAASFWLRYRKQWKLTSEVVFLLAGAFYGAMIWLIAQIFNIQSHYPDGIWFWAIGVLPFALCLDTLLLHALYVVLLAIWVGAEIIGFPAFHPWFLFHGWLVPNGAMSLPLLVLPGVIWAYRKKSVATVGLYAPLLAWWVILQPVAWHSEGSTVFFVGAAGALMLLIAKSHRVGDRMAMPYRVWGTLVTCGVLAPLSYSDMLVEVIRWHHGSQAMLAGATILGIGAAALAGSVWLQRRSSAAAGVATPSLFTLLQRQWMPVALMLLFAALCFWVGAFQNVDPDAVGWHARYADHAVAKWNLEILMPMLAVNVAMVVFAVWLMRQGLQIDRGSLFAGGVLYFLLWSVLRYFDLFADIGGMLGAALMFLLCGVGLFIVARFWQHHKESDHA
jgi:hypothetical protein